VPLPSSNRTTTTLFHPTGSIKSHFSEGSTTSQIVQGAHPVASDISLKLQYFSTHIAPSAITEQGSGRQGRRPHNSRHHASDSSRGQNFFVCDFNYSATLQKSTFSLQNESQSNVYATPGVEPDRRSPCASAFLRVLTFLSQITMFGPVTFTTFIRSTWPRKWG
jgi:hypothetical protein